VFWARFVAATTIVMSIAGTVMLVLAGHLLDSAKDLTDQWFGGLGLVAIFLALTGGLIAVRRPGNRIAWLLLVPGLCYGAIQLGSGYSQGVLYAGWPVVSRALWPVVWVVMWSWAPALASLGVLLPLFFPTGRLPSPRWRPVAVFTFVSLAAFTVGAAIATIPATDALYRRDTGQVPTPGWLSPWFTVATLMVGIALVLSIASAFVRYHRATGIERQQLKWFSVGSVVLALGVVASFPSTWWTALIALFGLFVFIGCIGVALLRYRLYDLGRIVSRALAYAVVTALLVGVYAAVVVGLGAAFGRTGSPVLIAGATLLVAAMFGPLRRRVQAAVDRRFNRRRYDAERALGEFAATLRDETALEQVRGELLGTVRSTVQPATASLWLRTNARGEG
jgi:hypothetical protein